MEQILTKSRLISETALWTVKQTEVIEIACPVKDLIMYKFLLRKLHEPAWAWDTTCQENTVIHIVMFHCLEHFGVSLQVITIQESSFLLKKE